MLKMAEYKFCKICLVYTQHDTNNQCTKCGFIKEKKNQDV